MKVRLTFDVGPDERRALAERVGRPGLANRDQVAMWIRSTIRATLDVIVAETEQSSDQGTN